MAQQTRTRWAKLRVGLMAIVSLGILAFLVFLLSGGLFRSKVPIFTFMKDSSDLGKGAPVRLNGIVVGEVSNVELSGLNQVDRTIRVQLDVFNDMLRSIPVDSSAKISAGNLLGTKFINISRGSSAQSIKAGSEIQSSATAAMEDLFQKGDDVVTAMELTLTKVNSLLDEIQNGKGTIGKFLTDPELYNKFLAITNDVGKMVATVNTSLSSDQNSVGKLLHDNNETYNKVHASIDKLNRLVDDIDHGPGAVGKLIQDPALYDDVRKTIADFRLLLTDLNAGKGTAGKLLKSEDLHNQIQATIGRLDVMLDKINSGQGTIGQLLVNPSLYESADGLTREMRSLLQDFRKNPKKFLTIQLKLF